MHRTRIGNPVTAVVVLLALRGLVACGDSSSQPTDCPGSQLLCDDRCVDTQTDRDHCGGCADSGGDTCGPGELCVAGGCELSCPSDLTVCDDGCVDTQTDPAHCGGCADSGGDTCGLGETCTAGQCELVCPVGFTVCDASCIDTQTDPAHCGGCAGSGGDTCEPGVVCEGGSCAPSCPLPPLWSGDAAIHIGALSWSSNGSYLAQGGDRMSNSAANDIQIYQFLGTFLSPLWGTQQMIRTYDIDWSPNDQFLFPGGSHAATSENLHAYSFSGSSGALLDTLVLPTAVRAVDHSPIGDFVAVGLWTGSVRIYSFDGVSYSLLDSFSLSGGEPVNDVAWSPDGQYLAIAADLSASGDEILVAAWNGSTLSMIDSVSSPASARSLAWNSAGTTLAVGGDQSTDFELSVLGFDGVSLSLLSGLHAASNVLDLDWSPTDDLLAAAGTDLVGDQDLVIAHWDGAALSYDATASYDLGELVAVDIDPTGDYIAVGGARATFGPNLFLLNVCQ